LRIDYSPFFRSTVAFDRLIGLLESASEAKVIPPYNIERQAMRNNYRVHPLGGRRLCRKDPVGGRGKEIAC